MGRSEALRWAMFTGRREHLVGVYRQLPPLCRSWIFITVITCMVVALRIAVVAANLLSLWQGGVASSPVASAPHRRPPPSSPPLTVVSVVVLAVFLIPILNEKRRTMSWLLQSSMTSYPRVTFLVYLGVRQPSQAAKTSRASNRIQ